MATVLAESSALHIEKIPDGGYLVSDGRGRPGDYCGMRFASSSIDEALKYMKSKLEPKAAK